MYTVPYIITHVTTLISHSWSKPLDITTNGEEKCNKFTYITMPADNKRVYWGLRTFCLVTGASRGIGQEIAIQFARKFKSGSLMVLFSRTVSGLEETKKAVEAANPGVKVKVAPADLYKPNNQQYYNVIVNALKEHKAKATDFEHAMIVHNAGVMITNFPTTTTDDLDMLHADGEVNLYSTISLNVQFLKVFPKDSVSKRSVIQTSSRASVAVVPGAGFYCMVKAARNMYFKTLAVEDPTLDVFSYGPGPVDTEMSRTVVGMADALERYRQKGMFLTCEKTVNWLVNLLTEGNYESGEFRNIYTDEECRGVFTAD